MDLKLLFAAVFLFAIASAIISDASRLVIPNWVPAILAGSFFPYALVYYGCSDALLHALVAFGLLAVGTILFLRGQFGAGDVKLLAAAGLWAGPAKVIPLVVWTSLAGLALAGTIVIYWWYLGRYHEAVELLGRAIGQVAVGSQNGGAGDNLHELLAEVHERAGDPAAGIRVLETALQKRPHSAALALASGQSSHRDIACRSGSADREWSRARSDLRDPFGHRSPSYHGDSAAQYSRVARLGR